MKNKQTNRQIAGNIGLFYVCCELSRRGWNVMPTSRNARGIDIVAYKGNALKPVLIQVKTYLQKRPVNVGKSALLKAFWVIVVGDHSTVPNEPYSPSVFILTSKKVEKFACHDKQKKFRWLNKKDYGDFQNKWNTIR